MATLKTNLIEPEGATTTLTVGEAGGDLVIGADSLKANTLKNKGGYYKYAAFTTTGANTWTCPTGVTSAEIVTVAGGGGGAGSNHGGQSGGGAGAGGVVHNTSYTVVPAVVYDITVGAGGAGGVNTADGSSGSNSVFNVNAEGSGSTVTAIGGAEGAASGAGQDGGSGGGSGQGNATGGSATQGDSGGGTGYGEDGGGGGSAAYSASGGGAGGVGVTGDTTNNKGGTGGTGLLFSNFTDYGTDSNNVSVIGQAGSTGGYFAGGGSGGSISVAAPGSPNGGGGVGGMDSDGGAGQVNTGGGGAGAGGATADGGLGGSGIVIIRYNDPTPDTLFVSDGSGSVSSVDSGWGGVQTLLSSQTASDSANISFTSGLDSTYKEYVFEYININPATDATEFSFQASIDGGSNYNVTLTSTAFQAFHTEAGTSSLGYNAGEDQAQGTSFQILAGLVGNGADECAAGTLHLFNPSSTTYVKNWYAETQFYRYVDRSNNSFFSGYFNTTSAINAVQFKFSSGNFDGIIKMYGIN